MSYTGIEEAFVDFGNSLGDSLRDEQKRRLLDNSVDYKKSILLTLRKVYPTLTAAETAGFTTEMLEHAIKVLRKNGYFVDMESQDIIEFSKMDEAFIENLKDGLDDCQITRESLHRKRAILLSLRLSFPCTSDIYKLGFTNDMIKNAVNQLRACNYSVNLANGTITAQKANS